MGYRYYKRFNYIYNPNYFSLWCDNEFMTAGNNLKKQSYISTIIIKHEHPVNNKTNKDSLYRENDKFNNIDKSTWNDRFYGKIV